MIHFTLSTVSAEISSSPKSRKSRKATSLRPPYQTACCRWTAPNHTSTQFCKTEVTSLKSTSTICLRRRKASSRINNWGFILQKMVGKCKWFWWMRRIWCWWGRREGKIWQKSTCMRKWKTRWKTDWKSGSSTSTPSKPDARKYSSIHFFYILLIFHLSISKFNSLASISMKATLCCISATIHMFHGLLNKNPVKSII